jgi:aspartyl-tRNA(Asn)/glutamyl-tRNA(Gln) amidotransferase subunit A
MTSATTPDRPLMTTSAMHYMTLTEVAALLRAKKLSPVELTRTLLDRISRLDGRLHSYITVTGDLALEQAKRAEREIAAGNYRGPLHGVPIAHKDIVWTKGIRTTAHSNLLADWVPANNATVYDKLEAAGSVCLGKTALHEFAYGAPAPTAPFPPALNPWHTDYSPGSSSSGSGAAVAAGLAMGATGTDTGGSIRHPAAVCAIAGMKPTYGRVSNYGVIQLAASLDHVGPMTRTVRDNAAMLQVMAGYDPRDAGSVDQPVPDLSRFIGNAIKGVHIGIPERYIAQNPNDPQVLGAFEQAKRALRDAGADLRAIEVDGIDDADQAGSTILMWEAYQFHKRNLVDHPEKYGAPLRERLLLAGEWDEARYKRANEQRERLRAGFKSVLADGIDVIVQPGRNTPAVTLEALIANPLDTAGGIRRMYNITRMPAMVLPMGFDRDGLPLGLQIAGNWWCEDRVYQVAAAYEDASGWSHLHPPAFS